MSYNESLQERQEYLFLVADNLIRQRDLWADDAGVQGLPVGGPLWMAAESICESFETGTIPGSCRNLCREVEVFAKHWREHTVRAEISPRDDLLPGNNVWAAIQSIAAARQGAMPRQQKRLEPVADLVAQKVSDEQIAKIYGWKDALGHWDLIKVREAKAHPGRHDGDEYYAAQEREREKVEQLKRQRAEALAGQIGEKVNHTPPVAPESIETLVAQKLTAHQIAKAKVIPVEMVYDYCRKHQLPIDGIALEPLSSAETVSQFTDAPDQPFVEQAEAYHDEPADEDAEDGTVVSELSIDEQILYAADNEPNAKPGEIAKLLGVSPQKVVATLSRREEIEQTA